MSIVWHDGGEVTSDPFEVLERAIRQTEVALGSSKDATQRAFQEQAAKIIADTLSDCGPSFVIKGGEVFLSLYSSALERSFAYPITELVRHSEPEEIEVIKAAIEKQTPAA